MSENQSHPASALFIATKEVNDERDALGARIEAERGGNRPVLHREISDGQGWQSAWPRILDRERAGA